MTKDRIVGNAVIGQSGGPTAVINQSLVGVVEGLRAGLQAVGAVKRILGMRQGVRGLTRDDLVDLDALSADRLEAIARTPSAALSSTRDKPDAAYGEKILAACRRHDIRYFFYIGGNDSSDTCRIVSELAAAAGYEMVCIHVPKTVDNDLVRNDHTPGYASAARFVALACRADFLDNASLPGIKLNVIMGRHAGFLTAASALARRPGQTGSAPADVDGPQLIYVPEVAFDVDRFVGEVEAVYAARGRCHVAISEGIQDASGQSIGASLIKGAQTDAHGNAQLSGSGALGDSLADLLKTRLTPAGGKAPRVRADTFGYLQRCWPDPSPVDQIEARRAGQHGARLALEGHLSGSVAIVRAGRGHGGEAYEARLERVELTDIAAKTRHMPAEFLSGTSDVSPAFIDYCSPLIGSLPSFERL